MNLLVVLLYNINEIGGELDYENPYHDLKLSSLMQKLMVKGICQGEFKTRAEALVACFERRLVYDTHSRRRNQLLPWVKIEGSDDQEHIPSTPIHPLDRK